MKKEIKACMGKLSGGADGAAAEFVFPETFMGFHGHFPGNPIVPGVCLVQCALVLAGEISARTLQVRLIKSAKFLATVSPGQSVQVECSIVDNLATASFASGETRIAALKMEVVDA